MLAGAGILSQTWGMYEPQRPAWIIVKSRISPEAWADRVHQARMTERTMKALARRVDRGVSLNAAIKELLPTGASRMGDSALEGVP